MTNVWKKVIVTGLAGMMITGALAGCSSKVVSIDKSNPSIRVMTKSYNSNPATAENSEVYRKLQEYLGVTLNMTWTAQSNYDEKVTAAMGAGEYPHAMLVGSASSAVIQNSRYGNFWEITDKIADSSKYPNLSQGNPIINHNISIDGKLYGVYRGRTLGRAGMSIREDWLKKLGLEEPKTIDDFYNVLKAFTEQDPDGDGQKNTYGMTVSSYVDGPLKNIAVWMGAPNEWGMNEETGRLEPMFMSSEFKEALDFMKKLYEEGLINADMATMATDKWDEHFLSNKAGVIIDVADRARRLAQNMKDDPTVEVGVLGYVKRDENAKPRTLPTTGYDGYYVFPTTSVLTEEDLDIVLGVMDRANDQESLTLANFGIEGRNYTLDADGNVVKSTEKAMTDELNDLNQFVPGMVETKLKQAYVTETARKVDEVYKDNEKYVVSNPAAPYISKTYSRKGPQLDSIMSEANTKYIVGQISEAEWNAAADRWKSYGGENVIQEINEQYQAEIEETGEVPATE